MEWMDYNLYYYDSVLDAVVMKDKNDNGLVIEREYKLIFRLLIKLYEYRHLRMYNILINYSL
jgi:ribosomal protein S17